jgi:hypothetical protein
VPSAWPGAGFGAWHEHLYNKHNRRIRFAHPAIELCLAYGVGAPAELVGSFFFPPLPAFTSTSVADIV